MQFFLFRKLVRLIPCAAKEECHPLVLCEIRAGILDLIQIQVWHLNWLEGRNLEGGIILGLLSLDLCLFLLIAKNTLFVCLLLILFIVSFKAHILNFDDTPNAANQELFIVNHEVRRDFEGIHSQVRKLGNVLILTIVKNNRDLIDYRILPILFYLGFDILALVWANIVFAQNSLDLAKAGFNSILIIGSAIHSKQVFQNICGNIRSLFHQSREVFSHYLAREIIQDFDIKFRHRCEASYLRNRSHSRMQCQS